MYRFFFFPHRTLSVPMACLHTVLQCFMWTPNWCHGDDIIMVLSLDNQCTTRDAPRWFSKASICQQQPVSNKQMKNTEVTLHSHRSVWVMHRKSPSISSGWCSFRSFLRCVLISHHVNWSLCLPTCVHTD